MKKILFYYLSILLLTVSSTVVKAHSNSKNDDIPPISEPVIIIPSGSSTGGNRDNSFPFSVGYDELGNTLVIAFYEDRPADLDLTNRNGIVLTHHSINASGTYYMELPQGHGTFYLFMTTANLCAYVTITLE